MCERRVVSLWEKGADVKKGLRKLKLGKSVMVPRASPFEQGTAPEDVGRTEVGRDQELGVEIGIGARKTEGVLEEHRGKLACSPGVVRGRIQVDVSTRRGRRKHGRATVGLIKEGAIQSSEHERTREECSRGWTRLD